MAEFSSLIHAGAIAIVIPWFGRDLKGGAEQQAWQVATRLAARGHPIEVLTTCCRSFLDDWSENDLPAGESFESGVLVRRFLVDRRDRWVFDDLNRELLAKPLGSLLPGVSPVVPQERAAIWHQQNINSEALQAYLQKHSSNYSAFVFLPYLYGITLQGLPLVAEKAWLQPCLHNEAYAYLPTVGNIFYQAKKLLFISAGEMQLASRLYGPTIFTKGVVAGAGIELEDLVLDQQMNLPSHLVGQRFVLCLGRRDAEKGTDRLVAVFKAFHQLHPASCLQLVLAGPGTKSYTDKASNIIDLGLVSNTEKSGLLYNCLVLCQPSINESFSRVLFEAWTCSKPVLVHRDCLATATAVQDAQGGWLASEQEEWITQLAYIDSQSTIELAAIGARGRTYAQDMADWNRVIGRYESLLGLAPKSDTHTLPTKKLKCIHQLLPNIIYGDAISKQAIQIRGWLHQVGYNSEIFALHIDPRVSHECQQYRSGAISPMDGIIYHHSIGSDITTVVVEHKGPKILIYHNITPAEFFYPYRPDFANLLRYGRESLWVLGQSFPISAGDSTYNAEELEIHGFNAPNILSLVVDPSRWNIAPDEDLMCQLQDGKHNLLFVGRYAPNKCQHHLVEAFASYLTLGYGARLILIGHGGSDDPYVGHIQKVIDYYGLREHVIMPGQITDAQLHAYYRTAHLFWSMSEHEGFCVPLIEAMWFDVPILAFRSSAISETIADTSLMFIEKNSFFDIAVLAMKLVTDFSLRNIIFSRQRAHRANFLFQNIEAKFFELISLL